MLGVSDCVRLPDADGVDAGLDVADNDGVSVTDADWVRLPVAEDDGDVVWLDEDVGLWVYELEIVCDGVGEQVRLRPTTPTP